MSETSDNVRKMLDKACEIIDDLGLDEVCETLNNGDGWCEEHCVQNGYVSDTKCVKRWLEKQIERDQEGRWEVTRMTNDSVNHPAYYTQGKIECIDFILDKKMNFCRGNAVKYIVRAGLKDPAKEIEDLEKAVFYLNREILDLKVMERKKENEHDEGTA